MGFICSPFLFLPTFLFSLSCMSATFLSFRKDDPSLRQNVTICRKLRNGDIRSVRLWIKVTDINLLSCKSFVLQIEFISFIVNFLFPQTTLITIIMTVYITTYFIISLIQQPVPFALYNINCSAAVNELIIIIMLPKPLNLCSVFPFISWCYDGLAHIYFLGVKEFYILKLFPFTDHSRSSQKSCTDSKW